MTPILIPKEKIQEAKEKIGDENAFIMAKELQLENFSETHLKACCCFHNEDTPSLVYNPKNYTFHCFGCTKTVDIIDVFMLKGCSYVEAVQKLFELAKIPFSFGEHKVKTKHQYIYPKEEKLSNDRTKVYEYLSARGISQATADYLDIRSDGNGSMVFNYYDTNDTLTLVKYRQAGKIDKRVNKNKMWCQKGADTSNLLFNMNRINSSEPLLIQEGELDAAAVIESGYHNAVSVPFGAGNTKWIEENWDWLEQFESIIVCADNDEPGIKMQKEVVYRLGSWRTKVIDIPQVIVTKDGRKKRVKDMNEVLFYYGKEAVIDLIAHAKDTPVPSLIDYSDVKQQDLSEIDGISFGLKELDHYLTKLYYGTFNIISGTPGSGKTSFLSQLVCQSLQQEKSVWLFSRELPEWQTKNWIDMNFAGPRNIHKYVTPQGYTQLKIPPEKKAAMNEYYRGQLKIYRDEFANDEDSIQNSMVDAARKYGSKLFIIDNLMTVDLQANEKNMNARQTEFINWLIQFSMRYHVVTLLVCHPRKMNSVTENVGMYDISGSSNMINLAHRAIGLRRVTPKEQAGVPKNNGDGWFQEPIPYNVIVNVIKDRLNGKANKEVGLYYDTNTRRFFSNIQEFNYQYAWDKTQYPDLLPMPINDPSDEVFGERKNM